MNTPLLSLDSVEVTFETPMGPVHAVRGVTLDVEQGEILGVVGESGCGKSVTFRAALGLTPNSAEVSGSMRIDGEELQADGSLRAHASMIYQNPGAALNPVFTIGQQLALVAGTKDVSELSSLLNDVGLPDPVRSLDAYPHEFSGGMRQRAVIAFALAQNPRLLIADEPTTALDVTTQAQVLDLIKQIQTDRDLSVVMISHDLGVIRRIADRVAVLYAGRVVEIGPTDSVLKSPLHPYTKALLASQPELASAGDELDAIAGSVPDGRIAIEGCSFAPRCRHVIDECSTNAPLMIASNGSAASTQTAACLRVHDLAGNESGGGMTT